MLNTMRGTRTLTLAGRLPGGATDSVHCTTRPNNRSIYRRLLHLVYQRYTQVPRIDSERLKISSGITL